MVRRNILVFLIFIGFTSFLYAESSKSSKKDLFDMAAKEYSLKKYEDSKEKLYKLLAHKYRYNEVLILLGDIYFQQNDIKKARKYYKKAMLREPGSKLDGVIINKIADTYIQESELSFLFEVLKQADIKDKANAGTYFRLGLAYEKIGMQDEAFDIYCRANLIKDDDIYICERLARLNEDMLRYEKAISFYNKILDKKSNDSIILYKLAYLYFNTGDIIRARQIMEKLVSLVANYEYYRFLGDIYYKDRTYNKAVYMYRKALMLNSLDEKSYLGLYMSFLMLKDQTGIESMKEKIISLFGNDKDLIKLLGLVTNFLKEERRK